MQLKGLSKRSITLAVGLMFATCLSLALACEAARAIDTEGWLITPEEAALPPAPPDVVAGGMRFDIGRGALDAGPLIDLVKPAGGKVATIPVEISVEFMPRSAPVDFPTLKVTVLKLFSIDITARVLPYATPMGIHIPEARLPSGEHTLRISLSDKGGGFTRKQITLRIPSTDP